MSNHRRPVPSSAPPLVSGLWIFTDHVCRECLGRVMQRMDGQAAGTFRCSTCGGETSDAIESLCACGSRLKPDSDLGFRCVHNPKRTASVPHEIAVVRTQSATLAEVSHQQTALALRPR